MFHYYLSRFTFLLFIIRSGYGLQCYNCMYLESILPPGLTNTLPSDATCKSGNSPHENLIVDCEYQAVLEENGPNLNTTIIYKKAENVSETTFTCGIVVLNGTLNHHYNEIPFRSIIRGCIPRRPSPTPFQELCSNGTLEDVILHDTEVLSLFKNYVDILDRNNTFTVTCSCNYGTCNGVPSNQYRKYKASYKATSKRSWDEDRVVVFFIVFAILLVIVGIGTGCYYICRR